MDPIDIITLVEKTPSTRLLNEYENKVLNKIKDKFTDIQQQLFVSNFFCFITYHKKNDFVIDFDDTWKFLGFTRKDPAKRVLENFFVKEVDYKMDGKKTLLNINTFKKLCLKSETKKADEIQDYYIKMQELLFEMMEEESLELRLQLENKERHEKEEEKEEDKKEDRVVIVLTKENQKEVTICKELDEKIGDVLYVGVNPFDKKTFKVGITHDINKRVSTLSTGLSQYFQMKKLWYTRFNKEIEESVKKEFMGSRVIKYKEFYEIEKYDEIVSFIDKEFKFYNENDQNPQALLNYKKRLIKNPTLDIKKPCIKCNIVKPLENFSPAKEHVDGRENRCRDCVNSIQAAYIENKRNTEPIPTEKACSQCKIVKPLDQYYIDNCLFDKRGTKCKDCIRLVQNREKDKKELTEYCCATCKTVKPIENFHKLNKSSTGYKYTCKQCELAKAKIRYQKHREQVLNGELDDDEKEKKRIENRKKTTDEACARRRAIVVNCPCGVITNELGRARHEKTKKHIEAMKNKT